MPKRWIGNSPWCDISVIWVRDVADNQVKGFIVENKTTPGFSVEKIEHKIALKVVQNGHITLKDCRVPEENHLQAGKSFRDTARVLKMTRYLVAWEATGCQMGAYEAALKYAQERLQFGKPIGSFQLIQDLLGNCSPPGGYVDCTRDAPARVRRIASRAPMERRRAVSMTERMSA